MQKLKEKGDALFNCLKTFIIGPKGKKKKKNCLVIEYWISRQEKQHFRTPRTFELNVELEPFLLKSSIPVGQIQSTDAKQDDSGEADDHDGA